MSVKLLTEHHLEFLSLKVGCTGSSESTLDRMPHCWKSHAMAQILFYRIIKGQYSKKVQCGKFPNTDKSDCAEVF